MSSFRQRLENTWYYLDDKRRLVPMGLPPLSPPLPVIPLTPERPAYYTPYYDVSHPFKGFQRYLGPDVSTLPRPSYQFPLTMTSSLWPEYPRLQSIPLDEATVTSNTPSDTQVDDRNDRLEEGIAIANVDEGEEEIDLVTVDEEDNRDGQMEHNNAENAIREDREHEENNITAEASEAAGHNEEELTIIRSQRRMPADAAITHIKQVLASYGEEGDPCPSILEIINSAENEELIFINHGMGLINPAFRTMVIPPSEVPGSFRCSRCQKDLKNAKCLRRHEENHLPLKHFVCLFCGKGFNDVYDLKRHTRTHTGSLPFTCPVVPCIKAFAQRITMENHMAKVHGVQIPYGKNERRPCLCVCELCEKTFTSRQELEEHKMTPHDPRLKMGTRKRHQSDIQRT